MTWDADQHASAKISKLSFDILFMSMVGVQHAQLVISSDNLCLLAENACANDHDYGRLVACTQ